jgi:glycosyltransferase involved in cell wall biosynthesis
MVREFAFSAPLTRWLWRNIGHYDLVHVHAFFSYASTTAMLIARQRQIPYLVRPLGLLCSWSLKQGALKKRIYLAAIEKANLDGASAIEYTAEQEQREAADLRLNASSFVLPFGIDLPERNCGARDKLRGTLGLPDGEPIILFLSRLHPKKGLEQLLAGLELLAKERFSLVIAGSGSPEYEAALRARVDSSPLKERVRFVGFVQDQLKQIVLQGSDVFGLTSHSESFAIAAMEAMAAGIPVLVTREVPLAELIERFSTGWITSQQPAAIAKASAIALDSLSDANVAGARRERCRQLAANFTWNRIALLMENAYESVLKGLKPQSFDLNSVVFSNIEVSTLV